MDSLPNSEGGSHSSSGNAWAWDVGIALAGLTYPAYRGAHESEYLLLPLPNFSISSERFSLGRRGAKLALADRGRYSLRLSAGGSLPVNSDDVAIREDMGDLHSSFEAGPALNIAMAAGAGWYLQTEILWRAVVATDLKSWTPIGWTLHPRLNLQMQMKHSAFRTSDIRLTTGPVYASHKYHSYFYDVAEEFARADRPSYAANSGYSGWRSNLAWTLRSGRFGLNTYMSYDNLHNAAFANSPLVQQKSYVLVGMMLSWRLWSSQPN